VQEMSLERDYHPEILKNLHIHLLDHLKTSVVSDSFANIYGDLLLIKASCTEKYFLGELRGLGQIINDKIKKVIDFQKNQNQSVFMYYDFIDITITLLAFIYTSDKLFGWNLKETLTNLPELIQITKDLEKQLEIEITEKESILEEILTNFTTTLARTFYQGFDQDNQQVLTQYARDNNYLTKTYKTITFLQTQNFASLEKISILILNSSDKKFS
jgi:hypothetical protein